MPQGDKTFPLKKDSEGNFVISETATDDPNVTVQKSIDKSYVDLVEKVGAGFAKKFLAGVLPSVTLRTSPEQYKAFWDRIDGVLLAINAAQDLWRDDGWAGGHVAKQLGADADAAGLPANAVAALKWATFKVFGGWKGQAFWSKKISGLDAVALVPVSKGSIADKVQSGDASVWENYNASKANVAFFANVSPKPSFSESKLDSIAKAILSGQPINIETGTVLFAGGQFKQLVERLHKPTDAVITASDVVITPQAGRNFFAFAAGARTSSTMSGRDVNVVTGEFLDGPEDTAGEGTSPLLLLGAGFLIWKLAKG